MSAITVDNELVHYEVLGRGGRPVILLHGWLGSWRYWVPTMQHLYMKYRVYAIDLFGFGDSSKDNPNLYNLDNQVAMLDEFMDQLVIPKAAIIGHGLGAMVAAEFAFQNQTDRVPRLMLVSPPLFEVDDISYREPYRTSPKRHRSSPDDLDRTIPAPSSVEKTIPSAGMMRAALLQKHAARQGDTGPLPNNIDYNTSNRSSRNYLAESMATDKLLPLLGRCFKPSEVEYKKLEVDVKNTDPRVLRRSLQEFDAGKLLDTIRLLEMPTVIAYGENDPITPPAINFNEEKQPVWEYITEEWYNDEADKEENGEYFPIIIPDVRHFPMLEYDRFGRLVNDFLETPDIRKLDVKNRWRRRSR